MAVADTYKAYTETVWNRLSALATWQPDVRLKVGDVVSGGPGGLVTRETSLRDLGVPSERVTVTGHDAAPVHIQSGVTISAAGSVLVSAASKARASFASTSSFLVVSAQGRLDSVDNMAEMRELVGDLHAREVWLPHWHLVTSVRTYPACTILIAKSAGVEAELTVDAGAAGLVPVENVTAGAAVAVNSDHASHWVMGFDSTPLYEAIAIKRRGVRRRSSITNVEYLTRDQDQDEPGGGTAGDGEEDVWTAQRSTPAELGLL
jgi:hypothetical protein